jgi:hypothetical protein
MKGAIVGAVLFIPAIIVVFLAAGGGHGSYIPAKLLFPYLILVAAYLPTVDGLWMVGGLAQFILYGYFIQRARKNTRIVVCAHAAAAVVVILLAPPSFTP